MKLDVELITTEIIKPTSPTPPNLRHYQLSFLDQVSPKVYNPLILYYASNTNSSSNNITQISIHLKNSLSKVLTLYYPLAGRVKKDKFIDCNDEGVPFLEAQVKAQLSDVIDNPVLPICELNKFVPFELDDYTETLLGVQLNFFELGGIAIGVCMSHQIADALSCIMFIKTWMSIARGEADIARPEFVSGALFPQKDISHDQRTGITKINIISKRFVFDAIAIEALRAKYEQNTNLEEDLEKRRTSRVEALSAFIFSRFLAATKSGSKKLYTILHPVNIRQKFDPFLPEHSFGNLSRVAVTVPSSSIIVEDPSCYGLVKQVREGIRKIDEVYVKKVQEGEDVVFNFIMEITKQAMIEGSETIVFSFTSLCWFPLYDADFGWDKPLWVSSAALTFQNVVSFMDSKTKGGIDAYISMKGDDMAKFEVDQEFQAFLNFSGSI